ncbi:hypothetical protein PVAND_011866 [Polypedilum vanderplanki]|uniref:Nicalin n=1 Tax=Polypedilum vanderplanki TaxID=319348 RepID=A0A9J6CLP1_POLVA|nr:hypothetical protein PVAND_011866 [Polypedilum vanderplanki]
MIEEFNDLKWIPYFLVFLLVINPSFADSNFANIQRMVQFDSSSHAYGCRSSSLNKEARALNTVYLSNGCVLARFQEITIDQFREIRLKAGGLIILLPKNLRDLSLEEKENIFLLEQAMLAEEIMIPVYFSQYDEEIDNIITEISQNPTKDSSSKPSAISEIFKKISQNSFQIVISGSNSPKKDSRIPIIQGELLPFKQSTSDGQTSKQLPVIVISTQLKPFGITNNSPPNFDATILLSMADMFSKLYNQVSSSAKYRIVFVLDESNALLNYQGVKKWLENNVEENVEFAICIESLAESLDNIYMHVSKPPKEGGSIYRFYEILKKKIEQYAPKKSLESVHKKINLADAFFKFPHERFSMRRVAAFTLSSLKSHTDPLKTSMFTEHASSPVLTTESKLDDVIMNNIETNSKILAESLASFIFSFNEDENEEIFTGTMAISPEQNIKPYVALKSLSKSHNIKLAFEKLLKNVKITYDVSTEHDPDFLFYDGEEAKLNIYNVKPAIFDLFLTSLIGCYLFSIYFVVINFPKFYSIISKFLPSAPIATTNGIHKKNN